MSGMHLRDYLDTESGRTASAIRARMNELGARVKDDAQIRQWAASRRPDPANARYLEVATGGVVTRQDMRPDDYADIWPELAGPPKRKPRPAIPSQIT